MYFEIIESTLLVEALRVDYTRLPEQSFCEHCGMIQHNSNNSNRRDQKKMIKNQADNISLPARVSAAATRTFDRTSSAYTEITTPDDSHARYSNHHVPSTTRMTTPSEIV